MGMFSNLTTDNIEKSDDRVGGAAPRLPTSIYDATIKLAYVSDSRRSKAQALNIHMEINGQEIREQIWFTNGQGQNFYVAKDGSGKHMQLPGFTLVNELCLLTTEQELSQQDVEEKVAKLWNYEERAEKNTNVNCLTDMHGKTVKVALLRKLIDKTAQTDSGDYKPTGDTVLINAVDKFLYAKDGRTVLEIQNNIEEAEFAEAWLTRNDNKDRDVTDKSKPAAGSSGVGRPGANASDKSGSATGKLFS